MKTKLRPLPPYDFSLALSYLSRSSLEKVDVVDGGQLTTLSVSDQRVFLLRIYQEGSVEDPVLVIEAEGKEVERFTEEILSEVARRFQLDVSLSDFYANIKEDPVLLQLAHQHRGLKPVLASSIFESLAWAIIGQQINIRFAYQLKNSLIDLVGLKKTIKGKTYFAFPDSARVAALSYDALTSRKFSRRKAEYLVDAARAVESGLLDLADLAECSQGEKVKRLTALRGVGRWTAEYCLLRGFGCQDAFPAGDIGLRNSVGRFYGYQNQPTEDAVRELGEKWPRWQGWGTFYLWFAQSMEKRREKKAGS